MMNNGKGNKPKEIKLILQLADQIQVTNSTNHNLSNKFKTSNNYPIYNTQEFTIKIKEPLPLNPNKNNQNKKNNILFQILNMYNKAYNNRIVYKI